MISIESIERIRLRVNISLEANDANKDQYIVYVEDGAVGDSKENDNG